MNENEPSSFYVNFDLNGIPFFDKKTWTEQTAHNYEKDNLLEKKKPSKMLQNMPYYL